MKRHPQHTPTKRKANTGCNVALVILALAVVGVIGLAVNVITNLFPAGYQSPYTWSNLTWTSKNRPQYTEKGQVVSKLGIDVSAYDGAIDWESVANDGIQFAIIRAGWRGYTEGGLNEDVNFRTNIAGAKAAGLEVGVYLFSSAITEEEAQQEAQLVVSLLHQSGITPDLPIAFDHEPVESSDGRANNLDSKTISAIARAFCKEAESAGYRTMIYGNQSDMARYDEGVTANHPVWLAQYTTGHPTAEFDFSIWQFTSTGTVDGINRNVDLDVWFPTIVPLS